MWLISTWTCFWLWLLLKLSMVGGVALECYDCSGEASCNSKPYNTVSCPDDPNSACLLVAVGKGYGVRDRDVRARQCATRDYIGEMGGSSDHCKDVSYDQMKAADDWIQKTSDIGMRLSFGLDNTTSYRVCGCRGPHRCNDGVKDQGEAYGTGPIKEKKKDDDDDGKGGSGRGAALHFIFGGVTFILSVWRAVHNHNHMDGF